MTCGMLGDGVCLRTIYAGREAVMEGPGTPGPSWRFELLLCSFTILLLAMAVLIPHLHLHLHLIHSVVAHPT